MHRAQLSLPAVEAAIGVVLILGVSMGFALTVQEPVARDAQLDAYARDAATVLSGEPPRHQGSTRLSEVTRSETAFDRERTALRDRVERILPDNLLFRVVTPHGTVGFRRPAGVALGVATVTTARGDVRIEVWYG